MASLGTTSRAAVTWIRSCPPTPGTDVIALTVRTRQSKNEIAEAARTRVYRGDQEVAVGRSVDQMKDYIQQTLEFEVKHNAPARVQRS